MNVFELMATLSLDTDDYDSSLESSEKKADSFGKKLKSGIRTAAKVGTAAVVAFTGATVAAGTALVNGVTNLSEYGDNIDKMSQKLGVSSEAYQKWDYVLGQAGTSMDNMAMGLKTLTNKMDDAKNGSEDALAMFEKLGISLEDLEGMTREDLFEAAIAGFQGMADSTERAALANDLFGRSGQELAPLFNTTTEETKELLKASEDLGFVLSEETVKASADYQDALDTMQRTMGGVKNNLLAEFMPSITTVMDGITKLFSGNSSEGLGLINNGIRNITKKITQALPEIIKIGSEVVSTLVEAFMMSLPEIVEMGTSIIVTLAEGIVENMDYIVEAGASILESILGAIPEFISSLVSQIPTIFESIVNAVLESAASLLEAIVTLVTTIAETLASPDAITSIVQSGLNLLLGLVDGILSAIPKIIEAIPQIVTGIISAILASIPLIIQAGIDLLTSLIKALPDIIKAIVAAIPEIITGIINAVLEAIPLLIDAGIQLFIALIEALPEIIDTIINGLDEIIMAILDAIIDSLPQLIEAGYTLFLALIENLPEIITAIVDAVVEIGKNIIEGFEEWGPKLLEWGEQLWDDFKENMYDVWVKINDKAKEVWEKIKSAVTEPIEEAKDKVKEIIDKIKDFFDFEWSLPALKLPHLSIEGSFSINPPSVPKFSIEWYAKAMNDGMILNGATIFGIGKDGNLLGGGEVGSEVVVGTDSLMSMIREATGSNPIVVNNYFTIDDSDNVEELAERISELINDSIERERMVFA